MRMSLENPSTAPDDAGGRRNPTDDEWKRDRKARIAAMTPRERFLYFLDYYKIPVLIAIAAVIFVAIMVRDIQSNLPIGFEAELLNANLWETDALATEFAEAAGIDLSVEGCAIDTDILSTTNSYDQAGLYSAEKLMVRIAAAELDVIAAEETLFQQYALGGTYMDLREALTEEELARFAPFLVETSVEEDDGTLSDPAPLGIRLDDAPRLRALDAYPNGGAVIGIVTNTKHVDRAVAFLKFLFADD